MLREDFSRETVGNVALTFLGLMRPLGVRRVIFVTDQIHAPRVEKLAGHILRGRVDVTVSPSSWLLSSEAAFKESQSEPAQPRGYRKRGQ